MSLELPRLHYKTLKFSFLNLNGPDPDPERGGYNPCRSHCLRSLGERVRGQAQLGYVRRTCHKRNATMRNQTSSHACVFGRTAVLFTVQSGYFETRRTSLCLFFPTVSPSTRDLSAPLSGALPLTQGLQVVALLLTLP